MTAWKWAGVWRYLHLTDRASDFWPQQVDFLVQPVQGKRPQGRIWFRKEADDAGG